jgi:hypothetical protein
LARELNEPTNGDGKTLTFETRRRDLTPVLHRLVEPTGQSGHCVSLSGWSSPIIEQM